MPGTVTSNSISLCLAAFCAVGFAEKEPDRPLLENGDFEAGPAGEASGGKLPPGWLKPFGTSKVLEVVAEPRPGSTGKQSLKIGTNEQSKTGGAYTELIPLDPKLGLYVSGWVRPGHEERKLRGLYFGVGWYDKARKPIIVVEGTTVNYVYLHLRKRVGDWYRMHIAIPPAKDPDRAKRMEVPPNAAFFDVRVFALGYPAPGWFDDLEAKQMSNDEVQKLIPKPAPRPVTAKVKRPAAPTDLDSEWLVGWLGEKKAQGAAEELAYYIKKVIGKPVSVVQWQPNTAKHAFLVTEAAHAPKALAARLEGKRRDAFLIEYPVKMGERDVCVLLSQDQDAYDRPVYYFLTKFMDVHWVGPGEVGEVLTPKPDWQIPAKIGVLENPDFEMRHWYSPAFSCRQWLAAGVRMGFHHALGHVFHPKKHGDTPEVYPLVGGKRYIPKVEGGRRALSGWQPCTAHPKSVEIATKHVLEAFKKNPRIASVSLSVNDGAGNICECELCRAQDAKDAFQEGKRPNLSDRFFRFYNTVAERAREQNPNARVAVLGYGAVSSTPKEVKVDPGIYVFQVCSSVEKLKEWKDAGANPNLYMWLWDGGFLTIRPDLDTVATLIHAAHAAGGIGFYSECIPHWIISGPKFYVVAHLLWDTERKVDELLGRYFRLAYGEDAAPHVRAFFDKWYEIYKRRPPGEHFRTSWGWRAADQFQHLRREDFTFMDDALAKAREAELTDKQRKRLEYLSTYYQLMRLNGDEYLSGKEMSDAKWLAEQDTEAALTVAERTTSLTKQFNALYKKRVLEDLSGWMIDAKYYRNPQGFWDSFVGQVRIMVSSAAETATDNALSFLTGKMLKEQTKEQVVGYWEAQMERRPALASYIGPQINRLKGIKPANIVVNGSFEEGEPGDPPKLPGWDYYQFYGMVKGVKARYEWKKGSGQDGGRAIAFGEGRYPEMKAIIQMEKDARYELSFWYKTRNRDTGLSFWIFAYDGELETPRAIVPDNIHRFVTIRLEATDGEWRQIKRTIRPDRTGNFVIQLAAYYQKQGWLTFWDDVEIRKVW